MGDSASPRASCTRAFPAGSVIRTVLETAAEPPVTRQVTGSPASGSPLLPFSVSSSDSGSGASKHPVCRLPPVMVSVFEKNGPADPALHPDNANRAVAQLSARVTFMRTPQQYRNVEIGLHGQQGGLASS